MIQASDANLLMIKKELSFSHFHTTDALQAYTQAYLSALTQAEDEQIKSDAEILLMNLAEISPISETAVYLYSAALSIRKSDDVFEKLLDYCERAKNKFAPITLHYLLNQFMSIIFLTPSLSQVHLKIKIQLLFDHVVYCYENLFQDILKPIPLKKRNKDFVIVLTEQFLSYQHGPTKSAADRCKILIENMRKNVILINTAELMSQAGQIPFVGSLSGNYADNLSSSEFVEWKSCKIPYIQCEQNMPNYESLRILLNAILENRPSFIISIGSGKIMASLASRIVPTLAIGMVPSDLSITGVKYQTLGRPLNDEDRLFLSSANRDENSIIVSVFGSSINEKITQMTRESANLPAEVWLAAIVGARLNMELTEEFWSMAEIISKLGVQFVLIGLFDVSRLESIYESHSALRGKIHCLGFIQDVISYLNLCDLYINPYRRGGGTSCVEAMFLGIPVITSPYGDVPVNSGPAFQTDSYQTMPSLVERYLTDFDFYSSQSKIAKERATLLLNATDCFAEIIREFQKRAE